MAVDTQAKRMSALNFGQTDSMVMPISDGDVDAADKQWLWGFYSGIVTDIATEDVCLTFSSVTTIPSITGYTQSYTSIGATADSHTSLVGGASSGC